MITVFGGYGTFGVHVARALVKAGIPVRIAGRDAARAADFAQELGQEGTAADVNDPASSARALAGSRVAVNCAGPFNTMAPVLPEVCLAAGIHYVDIADDRSWVGRLMEMDSRFRERGLLAAPGCSSLPGISGALAVTTAARLSGVQRARVTLFIGNRNPKGEAAVRSASAQLGRPFQAPQGKLVGLRGPEKVEVPPPFGLRTVHDLDSPEYDLFPDLIGAREVRVKVGFEARMASASFAILARLGPRIGGGLTRAITPLARLASGFGHSGGSVLIELFAPDGARASASIGGPQEGQRMAALPAAFVAHDLYSGALKQRGARTAYQALGAESLLRRLAAEGFELAGA
jgi:saccharopine dehydrogenase-like NADP-dependent oxidoreductase